MKNKIGIAGVFILLMFGLVWGLWRHSDQVAVDRARESIMAQFENRDGMTSEQRRASREQLETIQQGLSDRQQTQLRSEMREMGQARMQARFQEYFEMTAAAKRARLDEDIDRMKRWQAERSERQRTAASPTASGAPGRGPEGRGPDRTRTDDGRSDSERRQDRRRRMLDHTTPEMRAQMAAYREDFNARLKERGLDPDDFRMGRGRGPR